MTVVAVLEEIASRAGQHGVFQVIAATIPQGDKMIAVIPIASIMAYQRFTAIETEPFLRCKQARFLLEGNLSSSSLHRYSPANRSKPTLLARIESLDLLVELLPWEGRGQLYPIPVLVDPTTRACRQWSTDA